MADAMWLMMLVTVVLIPVSGVFPMGHLAVTKAKNVEIGLYLANEYVNKLRQNFPSDLLGFETNPKKTVTTDVVGGTTYYVTRELYTVETREWEYNGLPPTKECDILDVRIIVDFPPADSLGIVNADGTPGGGNRTAPAPFVYTTRLYKDMKQFGEK